MDHPDELLRARLAHADASKSLIEHDLFELSQGIEGRTTNPVSLLFDNLQHPGADLGLDLPCMLEYKHHKDKEVSASVNQSNDKHFGIEGDEGSF